MKIPRHLTPKALQRANRKAAVDAWRARPRNPMEDLSQALIPRGQSVEPGTREARKSELVRRVFKTPAGVRLLDNLSLLRGGWRDRERQMGGRGIRDSEKTTPPKPNSPATKAAQESPAAAHALTLPESGGASERFLPRKKANHPSSWQPALLRLDFGNLFIQVAVFLLLTVLFFIAWHFLGYIAVGLFIFGIIGALCAGSSDEHDPTP